MNTEYTKRNVEYIDVKEYMEKHGGTIRRKRELDFSSNINPLGAPKFLKSIIETEFTIRDIEKFADIENIIQNISTLEKLDYELIQPTPGASYGIILTYLHLRPSRVCIQNLTYIDYIKFAKNLGIELKFYKSYVDNLRIVPDLSNIENEKNSLIVIVNPNNPTGTYIDIENVVNIIEKSHRSNIFLIDLTFIDFKTDMDNVKKLLNYDNVIIVKSLSKILGLPGLRLGYIAGKIVKYFLNSDWPLSTLEEFILEKLVEFRKYYRDFIIKTRQYVVSESDRLFRILSNFLKVYRSDIHIIPIEAKLDLAKVLEEYCIKIRKYCILSSGDYLFRISLRSRDENDILIDVLESIFNK